MLASGSNVFVICIKDLTAERSSIIPVANMPIKAAPIADASALSLNKILVSGIVTQSDWWMQLLANMFGKTIIFNDSADASAMGAAFMGMFATGMIDDLSAVKSFMQVTKTFEPDKDIHVIYQNHFQVYASLYPKFKTHQ